MITEIDLLPNNVFTSLRRTSGDAHHSDSKYTHMVIEYILKGKAFFIAKTYNPKDLIMHIPLPLQWVLCDVLKGFGGISRPPMVIKQHSYTRIFGMLCSPGYENRIIISHPPSAFIVNEPLVIIEFDHETNYPTYFELN